MTNSSKSINFFSLQKFFLKPIFVIPSIIFEDGREGRRFAPTFDIEIDFCSPEKACDLLFDELIDIFERNFM